LEGNNRPKKIIKNAETGGTGDNGLALLARGEPFSDYTTRAKPMTRIAATAAA